MPTGQGDRGDKPLSDTLEATPCCYSKVIQLMGIQRRSTQQAVGYEACQMGAYHEYLPSKQGPSVNTTTMLENAMKQVLTGAVDAERKGSSPG